GDTKKLKATVTTNDGKSGAASDVRWEAQDSSIIEVNGVTGDVKALQPGSTFITASVPGSSNTVTVPVKVEGI
ncbi:Ig-like domain-containing protein, partial [Acinetobacter baumannii]|uniref:Ig-like domain-containing protein n=1 Tax=Acinetobacter baumannii TaxID=470 RepID=UPI000A4F9430